MGVLPFHRFMSHTMEKELVGAQVTLPASYLVGPGFGADESLVSKALQVAVVGYILLAHRT